jgi:hypothetical protein
LVGATAQATMFVVSEEVPASSWREWVGSVSVDWWATLLAGVITALAVADVLPKIPW